MISASKLGWPVEMVQYHTSPWKKKEIIQLNNSITTISQILVQTESFICLLFKMEQNNKLSF